MPRTPEDKFKYDHVLKRLRELPGKHWWFATPRTRFGISGIPDILGVYEGIFVAIEVKRPDGKGSYGLTATQSRVLNLIQAAGGTVWMIGSHEKLQTAIDILTTYCEHRTAGDTTDAERRPPSSEGPPPYVQ